MFFIVMCIVAGVLLFTAAILATIGASSINSSIFINGSNNAYAGYQHLTIASALAWSALVVLIIILVVAAITGGFKHTEVSSTLLSKSHPTKADLITAYRGEKQIESGHTTHLIILIVLIVLALITLVVGIEAVVAAIAIHNMTARDSPANAAYAEAIATAVVALMALFVLMIVIIIDFSVRSEREKNLEQIKTFITKGEKQLGLTSIPTE